MSARENILDRIRRRQGRAGAAAAAERAAAATTIAAHETGPRPAIPADPVALFRERAAALSTTLDAIAAGDSLPAAVAAYLAAHALPRRLVCWPEFAGLDWRGAGLAVEARAAAGDDLVGLTGAFCAIAETGTLVLLSGAQTEASVSLLPETHIAVLAQSRIVADMEAAWALLRAERGAAMPRALNLVSGPSRTADIEQTLVLGAHGPYRVHVVLTE